MPSGVNMLTNSLKIWDATKTEFPKGTFREIKKYDINIAVQIYAVFQTI